MGAACTPPLEFADWTIPVPEGTPVIGLAPVAVENRTERIDVVETLRVGAGDDPRYSFFGPNDLAVGADGSLYVLDAGNHRIQAFDSEGGYLATIGREGDGPGEIRRGGAITAGREVLVRVGDARISTWALDGTLIADGGLTGPVPTQIVALPDDTILATAVKPAPSDDRWMNTVSYFRLGADGVEGGAFTSLTGPRRVITLQTSTGPTIIQLPTPAPWAAVSRRGDVYITNGDEYQILALEASGEARWASRTAWPRLPMSDEDKERAVLRRTDRTPAAALAVDWPTHQPALANGSEGGTALQVDGHGHLYVFPFVREDDDASASGDGAAGAWPVDVYDADGERLFAGLIDIPGWWDALGDFVYRFEVDAATEERVVVRYRLVEPFR